MIKEWILNTFFKTELEEATRKGSIDAFSKAHADILETMADDLNTRAKELAQTMIKDMLSPVDYRFVISRNLRTKQLMLGTVEADAGQIGNLKSEAAFFKDSNLWKILVETPRSLAFEAMFVKGDKDNFDKGRAMLFHIDSQQKILDTLLTYTQQQKPLTDK